MTIRNDTLAAACLPLDTRTEATDRRPLEPA